MGAGTHTGSGAVELRLLGILATAMATPAVASEARPRRGARRPSGLPGENEDDGDEEDEREDPGANGSYHGSQRDSTSQDESHADAEIASLLRKLKAKGGGKGDRERPKPGIGSLKLEKFGGRDAEKKGKISYKSWRKDLEAQQSLYQLEDAEMSLLIWLTVELEAKETLDILTVAEMKELGGLDIVWHLLGDAFGKDDDEEFEVAQDRYNTHRRLPGMSMDKHIQTLKKLKAEYLKHDPDTKISDKSFAQRMLNTAGLSKHQRHTVFFNAGALYDSKSLEPVLRKMHRGIEDQDARRLGPSEEGRQPFMRRGLPRSRPPFASKGGKGGGGDSDFVLRNRYRHKSLYKPRPHGAHYADGEDDVGDGEEEDGAEHEDLEDQSAGQYAGHYEDDEAPTEDEDLSADETGTSVDLKEAWAAGWSAKKKMADKKKSRGFTKTPQQHPQGGPDPRKVGSVCSSCGVEGHWRGDVECANVVNGKDKPHQKPEGKPRGVHFTDILEPLERAPHQVLSASRSGEGSSGGLSTPPTVRQGSVNIHFDPRMNFVGVVHSSASTLVERKEKQERLPVPRGPPDCLGPPSQADLENIAAMMTILGTEEDLRQVEEINMQLHQLQVQRNALSAKLPSTGASSAEHPTGRRQLESQRAGADGMDLLLQKRADSVVTRPEGDSRALPRVPASSAGAKTCPFSCCTCGVGNPRSFRMGCRGPGCGHTVCTNCSYQDDTNPTNIQHRCVHCYEPEREMQTGQQLTPFLAGQGQKEAKQASVKPDGKHEEGKQEEMKKPMVLEVPSSEDPAARYQDKKPAPVLLAEREEVQQRLYRQHEKEGRLQVSKACRPGRDQSEEQRNCPHYYRDLKWGQSASALDAQCTACRLDHVIYADKVWMVAPPAAQHQNGYPGLSHDWPVHMSTAPGEAISDSGCQAPVGGAEWHKKLQTEMRLLGIPYFEVPEQELFQFGAGNILESSTAFIYAVGIHGETEPLRMSCVAGSCPGLISPSDMERWRMKYDYGEQTVTKGSGTPRGLRKTGTGHPAFYLLEYGPKVDVRQV